MCDGVKCTHHCSGWTGYGTRKKAMQEIPCWHASQHNETEWQAQYNFGALTFNEAKEQMGLTCYNETKFKQINMFDLHQSRTYTRQRV